jgi:hypothetical protein
MIYSIFPKHTATVYERYPKMNTSRDEILELKKTVSSSEVSGTFNTRILFDFGLHANSSSMTTDGIVVGAYKLNLYMANESVPNNSFSYEVGNNAAPWSPGLGKSTHTPKTSIGVSWNHPSSSVSNWGGQSYPNSTGDVTTFAESDRVKDLRIDVTTLVKAVELSAATDKGLLLRRASANEIDGDHYGYVNFYSAKTPTIYKPRLEIHYDDSTHTTGSLNAVDLAKEYFVYQSNNTSKYKIDSTPKFTFIGREKYPTATYTASTAALVEYLPTSSYYSLVDVRTGETVVPFDTTYTKISCDATGNFANLKLSGLYPERLYQFHIRIDHEGTSDYHILDDMFRVYE